MFNKMRFFFNPENPKLITKIIVDDDKARDGIISQTFSVESIIHEMNLFH